MPHPLKLPRVLSTVVPLVRAGNAIINEFVTFSLRRTIGTLQLLRCATRRLPGFTSIIGALNDLSKPGAGLRCIQTVRINWRTFDVIKLPPGKVRSINFPILALCVGGKDERSFT